MIKANLPAGAYRLRLLGTATGALGLKIGAAALGFINNLLLARLLGVAEFGTYAIVFSAVNFAATVTLLGLPMLVTREVATKVEQGRWRELKGLLRVAQRWIWSAVLVVVGMFAILLASGIYARYTSFAIVAVAMMLVPVTAFNQLRAAILRGLHCVILADVPDLLLRPVAILIPVAVMYVTAVHAGAIHALTVQLAAAGLALASGAWWLAIRLPAPLKTAVPEVTQRRLLLGGLPFLVIAVISTLEGQVSLYLLGYLGGTVQAGLFQAANQIAGLIAIGLVAVNLPLQPGLAAAWARGDKRESQRLVAETARMGTMIALAAALVLTFAGEGVLRMYGDQYLEAAAALQILTIGQVVNAMAGSCGILLMMTGHQKVVMHGIALALLLNVATACLAIPRLDVVGGALASTLGMIFWNLFLMVYARIKLGVDTTILSGWQTDVPKSRTVSRHP